MNTSVRWSSRMAFIFAASAAAIGLGNVWRFPYLAGQNGGGAFVIVYLLCVVVLALPLLHAEVVLGRLGRKNPVATLRDLALKSGASSKWSWLGVLTLITALLIMTYYVVIVGWVLDYTFRSVIGQFSRVTAEASKLDFLNLQGSASQMFFTDTIVVVGAMAIIYLGVKKGLERAVLFMFPVLVILMLLLVVYSMLHGGFMQGLKFMFNPNFHQLSAKVVLVALGQAFFSLNVAMGVTMMFSAYLPQNASLIRCSLGVALADTGFALLAGLIIFPVVFAHHLQPGMGPSLIFQTLPVAFGQMDFGSVVATLFFLMLFFAAFSSVIALLEPIVCWLIEECSLTRAKAVTLVGGFCWVVSFGTIGSFAAPSYFSVINVSFFSAIDFITSAAMLPIGGILLAIFVGWILDKKLLRQELNWSLGGIAYRTWQAILCFVAPIGVILILLTSFGVL